MRKFIPALLFMCVLSMAASAQTYQHEFGFQSDNDSYLGQGSDRYYTNGLFLNFRFATDQAKLKAGTEKKIWEISAGQKMYNPYSGAAPDPAKQDRPFAGYLYAEGGLNWFYKNESILKLSTQLGVVGPESGAEQLQVALHKLIGYTRPRGWEYQITTTPAVQGTVFYSHKIQQGRYHEKADFHLQGELNAGTIWIGATVGAMARISLKGLLLPMYDSALHGAALNHDKALYKEQRELFLYITPNLNYQRYDATIQGSMFNSSSPVTYPLLPFRFNAEAGIKYRYNNWTYSYSFNYHGKELSNNVISGYYYGSIVLSRMF